VKAKVLLVCSALIISACAPQSDLDSAKKQINELRARLAALEVENAKLKAQIAKKPELPVTMSLRKAVMGPGYVAVFNTTVKSPVTVLATLKSAALGTSKQFELRLNPTTATELGHLEGAVIERGDTITLENNNYSPIIFSVIVK